MKLCIPVNEDQGLNSPVCAHFGSAPLFMIVDADSGDFRAIRNNNQHHAHGMCTPLASLQGEQFDGMVVGGIGMGALSKLVSAGIQVFLSEQPTIVETMAALRAGTLRPVTPETACGHHQGQHHTHDRQ